MTLVAVAADGRAAISADTLGGLRLWPSLDGERRPVSLSLAGDVEQLALVHRGGIPGAPGSGDFIAAIRDGAGAITLVRIAANGGVRARHQLASAEYRGVVALSDGFVAWTSDHVIEWVDADGAPRGRLVADIGQQIVTVAARQERAAAIVRDADHAYVRWMSGTGEPRWEESIALADMPREDLFAIAPTARRFAYADARGQVIVVDSALATDVRPTGAFDAGVSALGFVDDDTLAIAGSTLIWWRRSEQAGSAADALEAVSGVVNEGAASIIDGLAVGTRNGQLVLARPSGVRYLGYDSLALGSLVATSDAVVLTQGASRFIWLAPDLAPRATFSTNRLVDDRGYAYGQALGPHHVVFQRQTGDKAEVGIVDIEHPERVVSLVADAGFQSYSVTHGIIGVVIGKRLRRFKVDMTTLATEELLPALTMSDYSISQTELFDPARANGLVAATVSWERSSSETQTLTLQRQVGDQIVVKRSRGFVGRILGSEPDGTLRIAETTGTPRVRVVRDDMTLETLSQPTLGASVASPDATRFVMRDEDGVTLLDRDGTQVWHTALWGVGMVLFEPGGARVLATASGGVVALDARTGALLARTCGFSFGLHDTPSDVSPLGLPTVCEDPILR